MSRAIQRLSAARWSRRRRHCARTRSLLPGRRPWPPSLRGEAPDTELDTRVEAVFIGQLMEVSPDLVRGSEVAAPIGCPSKRERVEVACGQRRLTDRRLKRAAKRSRVVVVQPSSTRGSKRRLEPALLPGQLRGYEQQGRNIGLGQSIVPPPRGHEPDSARASEGTTQLALMRAEHVGDEAAGSTDVGPGRGIARHEERDHRGGRATPM
jgi:hypothetical protein